MSSLSPRDLFAGKIVGLGILGLIQTVIWMGTAYGTLMLAGRTFDLPASLDLPTSIWFWGVVFFLLGYAVYASLMAGLGALVPNLREGSQATFMIILPLLVPLFLIGALVEDPNGTLAMVLSIFPLTAPGTMITRLAAGGVPAWQPPLAALLLLGTAALIVRSVSRMFRAQTILSGEPFSPGRYLSALLGRT
jgi:ABC-2 type transport system permease protein